MSVLVTPRASTDSEISFLIFLQPKSKFFVVPKTTETGIEDRTQQ